jgi:hypothetical protein
LSRENIQPGRRRGKHARKATWMGAIMRVPIQSGVVEDPTARLETSCTRTGRPRRLLWRQQSYRTAGEGSGRTARVYVCEESHCGIVPMNHSHKDKQSSGESGEGRLRIKENTFPFDTYPTQCGTARVLRVGECADKLFAWPLIISDKKTGCAKERPSGSVRGAPGNWCPYRDRQIDGRPFNFQDTWNLLSHICWERARFPKALLALQGRPTRRRRSLKRSSER